MRNHHSAFCILHSAFPAFTLVESLVAMTVASILITSALAAASSTGLARKKRADTAVGTGLADSLVTEILAKPYQDPLVTPVFGIESGESASNKTTFDDVDDYNGWTETPPQDPDGTALTTFAGYKRTVAVAWVNPATPTTVSLAETGLKRVTVNVYKSTTLIATRIAYKSNAP